jgi:hypothetical protein
MSKTNYIIRNNPNNGPLEAFTIGPNAELWHSWQSPTGPGGWSGWSSLGRPAGIFISQLEVIGNARDSGPLEAFAPGSDGALWHIWQGGGQKDNWSNWESLGAPGPKALITSVEVVENAGKGTLEAFSIATDGALWHNWQSPNGPGGWNGWSSLGQPPGGIAIGQLLVAENAGTSGPLEAFALGSDRALWHIWQGGGQKDNWSNWESLGVP